MPARDAKPQPPSREEMAREYLESIGRSTVIKTKRDQVLEELDRLWRSRTSTDKPPTSVEIAAALNLAPQTVRQHFAKLLQEGRVHRMDPGFYVPTASAS